ncbi:hypothetical protein KGF54_002170 [Candida jiufengensis]|uniref:uncharacterized protein n=1 Tax=Candida jiufengensis TaxID=497108 RepID=UPI00222533B8|nr:uncharacterized protein KGF54_002170 [Candida jiufengensis]KAI5954395.1 hypothetical protein KGF54_002170 [Candida jiufengensis]
MVISNEKLYQQIDPNALVLNSGTGDDDISTNNTPTITTTSKKWEDYLTSIAAKLHQENQPSSKIFLAKVKHCDVSNDIGSTEIPCYDHSNEYESDQALNLVQSDNEADNVFDISSDIEKDEPSSNLNFQSKNNQSNFKAQGTKIEKEKETEGWELNAGVFVEKSIHDTELEISSSDDNDGIDSSSDEDDWWGKNKPRRRNKFFKMNFNPTNRTNFLNISNYPIDTLSSFIIEQVDVDELVDKDFKNLKSFEVGKTSESTNGSNYRYDQSTIKFLLGLLFYMVVFLQF